MFLDPETAIIQRLQERIDAQEWTAPRVKPRVLTAADMAAIDERSQIVPAVYVVFDSYIPTQEVGAGSVQEIQQSWTVVVAVRNASDHASGAGVRREASPLVELVLSALAGWKPAQGFTALRMAAGPGAVFSTGVGYYPMNFLTRTVIRGAP
jgi:hypothetical protein